MSRKSRPPVFGMEMCLHVLPSSLERKMTPSDPEAQIMYCSRSFLPASRTTLTPRRFASLPDDCTDHHGALSFSCMNNIAMRSNMADILPVCAGPERNCLLGRDRDVLLPQAGTLGPENGLQASSERTSRAPRFQPA